MASSRTIESRPPETATTTGALRATSDRTASVTRADPDARVACLGAADRVGLALATMGRYISGSHSRPGECCGDARTARSDLGRRGTDRVLHRADLDQLAARPVSHTAVHHPTYLAPGPHEGAQGSKGGEAERCLTLNTRVNTRRRQESDVRGQERETAMRAVAVSDI